MICLFHFYEQQDYHYSLFFLSQMNLPQIQRILQEFEKQSEIMDMKEEIMNEAMDDAMEDDGDEEETLVIYCTVILIFLQYTHVL